VSTQVIINLPVADLAKSMAFFKALGYSHNPQSTDDTGACIVVSDTISVMLLTQARFRDFTPKAVCDTSKAVEVLLTLSCESREQVDSLVAKAVAAGGSTYDKPEDYGFMYTHSFGARAHEYNSGTGVTRVIRTRRPCGPTDRSSRRRYGARPDAGVRPQPEDPA
jgi:predicted lactoylglutathione lyase